ncbi:MAG: DedA family protein [Deltaproteobacteria bacterium]|nr:DedA family protein [Deltaproteobacteria bacterium]
MELLKHAFDVIMHLDKYLHILIQNYGFWTYLVLFLIIFCETGLVVTPVLPGDSLLFALGNIAAMGALNVELLLALLIVAAILGDTVNYGVGRYMGPKVFTREDGRIFKKAYLDRTRHFYARYGGKTIVIARFVPIVRTFAPFVAGVGSMTYGKFVTYNVIGGIVWISSFIIAGYYFGNLPIVKHNFTIMIFSIIIVSLIPAVVGLIRTRGARA